jgi:hypothetical protein
MTTPGGGKSSDILPDKRPKKESYAQQAGDRVRLSDGTMREVVQNPLDGVWMILKDVGADDGDAEMVLLSDIDGPA